MGVRLIVLLWAVCVSVMTPAFAQGDAVATVIGIRGTAWSIDGQSRTQLAMGSVVAEGALVETGADGRVKLRFIDRSVVVLSDSSQLRIKHFAVENGQRSDAYLRLDIGLMNQQVAPGSPESWRVSTPTVVTAVRGTEYWIEVKNDLATQVSVRTGSVAVESLGDMSHSKVKTRSTPHLSDLPPMILLNKPNLGTVCNSKGECQEAVEWQAERLRSLEDRCSGV